MNVLDLHRKINEVASKGYIKTTRHGNTGVGKTLEDLLGIEENNRGDADIEDIGIEVKSSRQSSDSNISLFAKVPPKDMRKIWRKELIEKFGYYNDEKNRKSLQCTLSYKNPNGQNLFLDSNEQKKEIYMFHTDYGKFATYPLSVIKNKFESKFPALLVVSAEEKTIDGDKMYKYTNATLRHGFSFDNFMTLLKDGYITVDFRMYIRDDGTVRDRGTAWRIENEEYFNQLYSYSLELL